MILSGLTGPNLARMVAAHDLYRAGKWEDFISAARDLRRNADLTECEKRYLRVYSLSATGFAKHAQPIEIAADMTDPEEFQARTRYWGIAYKSYHWAGRRNEEQCPLFWSMPLPSKNTLSLSLARLFKKGGSTWMLIDQTYRNEFSLHRPRVLFCWEDGKIGVTVADRDASFEAVKSQMAWRPCPNERIPVRIAWSDSDVKVWIGSESEPCVNETSFADVLSSTRQHAMHYSFHGDNIRIFDIKATIE